MEWIILISAVRSDTDEWMSRELFFCLFVCLVFCIEGKCGHWQQLPSKDSPPDIRGHVSSMKERKSQVGKSILQVPDTGTRVLDNTKPFLYCSIVSFWITLAHSKEHKYHIFRQYWYTRNVPVFTNTGTFQYLGPQVYFFRQVEDTRYPLYNHVPAYRLAPRENFLKSVELLSTSTSESMRVTMWEKRFSFQISHQFHQWHSLPVKNFRLPAGAEGMWAEWKCLNRLRIDMGRCKVLLHKWRHLRTTKI